MIFKMLVGLPASGKSTWTDNFLKGKDASQWMVVSTDKWIDSLCAAKGLSYSEGWKRFNKEAEKKMAADLAEAISKKLNIIWDQTNITSTARKKKLIKVPNTYTKEAVYFVLPEATEWNRRLASRPGKVIPGFVLGNMRKIFEMPTQSEGFAVVHIVDNA